MLFSLRLLSSLVALFGAMAVPLFPASAQEKWPAKAITYVVPFPTGGTTDTLARLIGQRLGAALGTTIVVDNKPGAGGNIGSEFVARAAPDGYTILGGTISSHAINVSLYSKLGYDPFKSFADVLAAAREKPGSIAFASAGNGTSQHLSGELFKSLAKVDLIHIPYKGSAPAIQDVMSGQVPMMFDTSVVAGPHIQSGKLRALAVTSSKRAPAFPNVPTVAEAGLPGYELVSWQAIFAPAGTPQPIVDRLYAEIAKILKSPEMQERLANLG